MLFPNTLCLKTISFTILRNGKTRPTGDRHLQPHREINELPTLEEAKCRLDNTQEFMEIPEYGGEQKEVISNSFL